MKELLNSTFFNFLLGFFAIVALSLSVIMVANYYQITLQDVEQAMYRTVPWQAAAALLFGEEGI